MRVTAAGNVVFDIGGRLSGKGDSLRYGEGTQLLELDGSPMHRAELHMGAGRSMGLGLA